MNNIKETIKFFCAGLYFIACRLFNNSPRRIVLYYHGVKNKDASQFKKQMKYLAEKYAVVTPSAIKTAPLDSSKSSVAITFDDAFANLLDNALPVLKALHLPAAICVPAGNLGQTPQWHMAGGCDDKNETILTAQQLSQLNKDGFEIFSHSMSHPKLTSLDDGSLACELTCSKQLLRDILAYEVVAISYPHGSFDDRVVTAAKKAGYKLGFTIEPAMPDSSTNNLKIPRTSVSPADSLLKFKLKAAGAYQFLKYKKLFRSHPKANLEKVVLYPQPIFTDPK